MVIIVRVIRVVTVVTVVRMVRNGKNGNVDSVCCVLCVVCCVCLKRNPTEYRGIPQFGRYSTRLVQYMVTAEKSAKITVHPVTLCKYLQGIRSSPSTS